MTKKHSTREPALLELFRAIATDSRTATRLVTAHPAHARDALVIGAARKAAPAYFIDEIARYMYAGDTALHIAAAAYRSAFVAELIALGATVNAANRRRQQPLHYAVDGGPGAPHWDPHAQKSTIRALIEAGADPNAIDAGGVTPLHRAVRNRCSLAVKTLLELGADPRRKNANGSTPAQLATQTTGRGGTGGPEAKAQQAEIVKMLATRRKTAPPPRTAGAESTFELRRLGVVRSTLTTRRAAPRQGREGAPDAWLELDASVRDALDGLETGDAVVLITWLHLGDRSIQKVHPRGDPAARLSGVFATRSPDRPNPLGLHRVTVREIAGTRVRVGPLEAIDGTPIVDIKITLRSTDDS